MRFLRIEGAVIRETGTGEGYGETRVVCLECFHEDRDPILMEEMMKEIELPVYCDRCGKELLEASSC